MNINTVKQASLKVLTSEEPKDVSSRKVAESKDDAASSEKLEVNQVQAEELLNKIKALSDDGKYSVRFDFNEQAHQFVVRVVDPENDEVIRQMPAEEILGMKALMREFRGQLVSSES